MRARLVYKEELKRLNRSMLMKMLEYLESSSELQHTKNDVVSKELAVIARNFLYLTGKFRFSIGVN